MRLGPDAYVSDQFGTDSFNMFKSAFAYKSASFLRLSGYRVEGQTPNRARLLLLRRRDLEYINLGLEALSKGQIVSADLKPACRPLIKIQAPPNLNMPAIIKANFTVVHIWV